MDIAWPANTQVLGLEAVTDGTTNFVQIDLAPLTTEAAHELLELIHVDRRDKAEGGRIKAGGPMKADPTVELLIIGHVDAGIGQLLEAAPLQTEYGF